MFSIYKMLAGILKLETKTAFLLWGLIFLFSTQIQGQESVHILNDNIYGDISDGLPDNFSSIEVKNRKGNVIGIGNVAYRDNEPTDLRVGYWKEYNENGRLEKEGTYKLGSYVQCCFGGPCSQYYYYRTGLWKFYNPDGSINYELVFKPSEIHIDTNCEGGDKILFGIVDSIPLEYIDKVSANTIFESQKVIMKTENWTEILIPLNGKLYVEWIKEN